MKIKNIVIICCIVCFYSLIPIQAQPNVALGPERVQELVDEIASCKRSIKELEIIVKDLGGLKKDYPEWFKLSGATIDLGRNGNKTPWELEKETRNLIISFVRIRSAFVQFRNPE